MSAGDVAGAEVAVLDSPRSHRDYCVSTKVSEMRTSCSFAPPRLRGDRTRAVSLLNRAERLSWERGWGVVIAMLLVERTRVLLSDGNIARR